MTAYRTKKGYANVEYMLERHLPEVVDIEQESFALPWTKEDFIRCHRQRNCRLKVALIDEKVVGYMVYELDKDRLYLLNLAIDPEYRRKGAGGAMIQNLVSGLSHKRRKKITLEVGEDNLDAQLFFKAMGFRGTEVIRDFYEDTHQDAYSMQYRLPLSFSKLLPEITRHLQELTGREWDVMFEHGGALEKYTETPPRAHDQNHLVLQTAAPVSDPKAAYQALGDCFFDGLLPDNMGSWNNVRQKIRIPCQHIREDWLYKGKPGMLEFQFKLPPELKEVDGSIPSRGGMKGLLG